MDPVFRCRCRRSESDDVKRLGRHPRYRRRALRMQTLRRMRFAPRLLAIVLLMMVAQQMALAAYACRMPPSAIGSMLAMASMPAVTDAMRETCPQMHGFSDRWLCTKHCAPDTTLQHDIRSASVPPSLLGILPSVPVDVALRSLAGAAPEWRYRLRAPPPPATLLFCSLLI